jgi:hypothetical protein
VVGRGESAFQAGVGANRSAAQLKSDKQIAEKDAARQDRQNDLMEQLVHGKGGSSNAGGGSSSPASKDGD